jgi:predicted O-methyltransferase YrrM
MEKNLESIWLESLNFKIQQKKNEWIEFIKYITKYGEIKYTLEIGCYDGGTTIFLSNFTKNLITIDQPETARFDTFKYNIGTDKYGTDLLNEKTNFTYVPGNSHSQNTLNNIKSLLNENKLDLLFIDGDHSYNGVKEDFIMYSPLVKKGGIIAFHDVHRSSFHESHGCYVHNFWDELCQENYDYTLFYDGEGENNVWGGIGTIIKNH